MRTSHQTKGRSPDSTRIILVLKVAYSKASDAGGRSNEEPNEELNKKPDEKLEERNEDSLGI